MNDPKRQHHLPQMFLEGFLTDGHIYMYDHKKDILSDPRSKESVGFVKHLYTVLFGEHKDFGVEEMFREIENDHAELFREISTNGFKNLEIDDISALIQFIMITRGRSPISVNASNEISQNPEKIFGPDYNLDQDMEYFAEQCKNNKNYLFRTAFIPMVNQDLELFSLTYDVILSELEPSSPNLVLNDRYNTLKILDRFNPPPKDGLSRVNWGDYPSKFYFPVTKRHCLTFSPKSTKKRRESSKFMIFYRSMNPAEAHEINQQTLQQMNRYAYCSDREYFKELIDNTIIPSTEKAAEENSPAARITGE